MALLSSVLTVNLHPASVSEDLDSRTLRLRVEEIVGAGAEEGGEGGGEGVGAGGRHVVGGVAGGGGVVAGHGGGGRGEVFGGGGEGRLGWQAAQLTGVDCAEWRPLAAVPASLERTPGLGREVLLLQGAGGTGAAAPALQLGLVLSSDGQLVTRRLLPPAQLGLDAGCGVAGGGPPSGVVVVVPRPPALPALLLVQPLRLPELRPPVLEPDLARNTRLGLGLFRSGEIMFICLSDHQFLVLISLGEH